MVDLGLIYCTGDFGVIRNYEKGRQYISKAAKTGNRYAVRALKSL